MVAPSNDLTRVPASEVVVDRANRLTRTFVQFLDNLWRRSPRTGSFVLGAAPTTTVANTEVLGASVVLVSPTNAAAAALMAGAASLYVSAKTSGVGFTVATANGAAAGGTESFDYVLRI